MKLSNENKLLIGVGVVGSAVLAYLYYDKNKNNDVFDAEPMELAPEENQTNPAPAQGTSLNKNLILKKGSKGLEVRELQRLLGVSIDGDFGNNTLTALKAAKGVSQISINSFSQKIENKATPVIVYPKKGEKLMTNAKETLLFLAEKKVDGSYFNTGKSFIKLDYGKYAGLFLAAQANGNYLVQYDGTYCFLNGKNVKTY